MGKYNNKKPNKGYFNLFLYTSPESDNINLDQLKKSTDFKNPYDVDEKIDAIFNPQKTNISRKDESRNSKASKSNYILTHKPNGKMECNKQGLLILAADENMAFYDWDLVYRSYRSNAQNEQEQNEHARRTKKEIKRDCIKEVLYQKQREYNLDKMAPVNRIEIELYKKFLYKVSENEKLLDWLYKENHIGITEENKDKYIKIVGFEPADGGVYINLDEKWKENKDEKVVLKKAYKEARRFINYKKKNKEIVDWAFDYEKCKRSFVEEFGQDLTEDEKNLITPEFCERFIQTYIRPYWGEMREAKNNRTERKNIRTVIEDYKKDTKNSKESIEVVIENLEQVIEIKIKKLENSVERNIEKLQESVKRRVENFEDDIKKAGSDQKNRMLKIIDDLNENIEKSTLNLGEKVKKITYIIKDDTKKAIAKMEGSKNCKNELVNLLEEYEEKLIEKLKKEAKAIDKNVEEEIINLISNTKENINEIAKDEKISTKSLERHMGTLTDSLKRYVIEVTKDLEEFIKKLDEDPKEDRERKIKEFHKFLERYNKLNSLYEQFDKAKKNNNELKNYYNELMNYLKMKLKNCKKKNKKLCWGAAEDYMLDEADKEKIIDTKESIREFFDYLGVNKELDKKTFNIVEKRIRWITINVDSKRNRPIFLIGMVMRFGTNFLPNKKLHDKVDSLFKPCSFYKRYRQSEKLHYGLIRLLDKFHNIYELNMDERVHSWNDFFHYEGRDILSDDEVTFWRKYLGDKYDRLPAIGFQLYFVDCVESCMPIYRERLQAYMKIDGAIKEYMDCVKNIKEFYDEESREITEVINKHQLDLIEFQSAWSDPSYNTFYYYRLLNSFLVFFSNCSIMRELPNERCKVLELEVILRIYQNRQAKNKMYNWFKEIYGCSLDNVVDAAKHSAKRQAVHCKC